MARAIHSSVVHAIQQICLKCLSGGGRRKGGEKAGVISTDFHRPRARHGTPLGPSRISRDDLRPSLFSPQPYRQGTRCSCRRPQGNHGQNQPAFAASRPPCTAPSMTTSAMAAGAADERGRSDVEHRPRSQLIFVGCGSSTGVPRCARVSRASPFPWLGGGGGLIETCPLLARGRGRRGARPGAGRRCFRFLVAPAGGTWCRARWASVGVGLD